MTLLLPARCETGIKNSYQVIYADPPWSFRGWSWKKDNRSASAHYDTVETKELCRLPVGELAAENCALFMWATWPTLPDALELGAAWGFEYKTCAFDWLKRSKRGHSWHTGMGHWTRANSEPCLLFIKGTPKRKGRGVKQLIADIGQQSLFPPLVEKWTIHSAKPFEAYSRIEALLDGPYLELFARVAYPGWDVWGNQAPNCIPWSPLGWRVA